MAFNGWPGFGPETSRSRLREDFLRGIFGEPAAGVFPAVNLYDDGESFLVRAEIPGIDKDSLEITARGEQLTIRGERVLPPAGESASYHRREREGGRFRRVVTLPARVDSSQVEATYRNGILEIVLPRVAEEKASKIEIS
jgi:HSP20 family protein